MGGHRGRDRRPARWHVPGDVAGEYRPRGSSSRSSRSSGSSTPSGGTCRTTRSGRARRRSSAPCRPTATRPGCGSATRLPDDAVDDHAKGWAHYSSASPSPPRAVTPVPTRPGGVTGCGRGHPAPVADEDTLYDRAGGQAWFDGWSTGSTRGSSTTPCCARSTPRISAPGKRGPGDVPGPVLGRPAAFSEERGHPRLRARHLPFAIDTPERDAWVRHMTAAIRSGRPRPRGRGRLPRVRRERRHPHDQPAPPGAAPVLERSAAAAKMAAMTYRVIQWATGGVGRAAIEGIARHPELELVGCWVHSAGQGRAATSASSSGVGPIGVTATTDVDALLALDADCVLYAPMLADPRRGRPHPRVGQERRDAARLVLPEREQRPRPELEAACREGGVTLHGTGIHPGGITERFPLMVSALSRNDHPRARRGVLRHPQLRARPTWSAT